MNKKPLVIGKGHLGTYIKEKFNVSEDLFWKKDMMDLTLDDLKRLNPSCVINTAGKTDLTWCENNQKETMRCNVQGPLHLYRQCIKFNKIPLVHISSGCIWDGPYDENGEPFTVNSPVTPACFYAWTKAAGDALLIQEASFNQNLLILRPRQVYSPVLSPRNSLTKLNRYEKLLQTPNSMTSADTIILAINKLLTGEQLYKHRQVYNIYDKGYTTPFDVGVLLHQAGLRKMPEVLEKSNMDTWHFPKRVDTVLQDYGFERNVQPPDIIDELKRNIALYAEQVKIASMGPV